MPLRFAYSGMERREVWPVRRDDLGDVRAAPVPSAHASRRRPHPADPRAGARSVLRASGAAVRTKLLTAFTKVGAVCYGGGVLSLPALRLLLVERGVLSKQDFEEGVSLANCVPGFLLSNLAIFSGIRSSGALLAVPAILAAVLPSAVAMALATYLFLEYRDLPFVRAAVLSLQPVTLGMLVVMVIRMAPRSLTSWNQVAIAAAAAAMMLFFSAHPLVLLATVAGSSLLISAVRPGSAAGPMPVNEPPGTIYLAVKHLPRPADAPVRCHLFVAIDRASCWVCVGLARSSTPEAAKGFVMRLLRDAPFKITTLVIGAGAPFVSSGAQGGRGIQEFADTCQCMGLRAQVVGEEAPPPHWRIEQFNRRLKQVLLRQLQRPFTTVERTLQRYAWLHNECLPQKVALSATPSEILQQWWIISPDLFTRRPGRLATIGGHWV
jgi:chromate transporter